MEHLEEKVAVVTGGGSGIGRAVATQLADAGMHVVVADIQQDALEATVADLVALLDGVGDSSATQDAIGAFGQILSPDEVAAAVVDAVRQDRFYILTHPESTEALVRTRCDDIVEARHPSPLRP